MKENKNCLTSQTFQKLEYSNKRFGKRINVTLICYLLLIGIGCTILCVVGLLYVFKSNARTLLQKHFPSIANIGTMHLAVILDMECA